MAIFSKGARFAKGRKKVQANRKAQDNSLFGASTSVRDKMAVATGKRNLIRNGGYEDEMKALDLMKGNAKSQENLINTRYHRQHRDYNQAEALTQQKEKLKQQMFDARGRGERVDPAMIRQAASLDGQIKKLHGGIGDKYITERQKLNSMNNDIASFGTPQKRYEATNGDRLKMAGLGAAEYMWGGSVGQIAARNGAALGGIVGVNVGLDAMENRGGQQR